MPPEPTPKRIPPLRARLLGPVEIEVGRRALPARAWPRRQARSLLLLLLSTPGHRVPRDVVLESFWPDRPLDAGLNALYKSLHTLRRMLEPAIAAGQTSSYVEISDDSITLIDHPGLWVDVIQFQDLLLASARDHLPRQSLRLALDLFRGEFLADVPYVDWPIPRRETLNDARRRATLHLAHLDLEAGEPLASVSPLESLLASDPACEDAHEALIRAFLASGFHAAALQQVERCRLALAHDLDAEPGPEIARLAAAVREATRAAHEPVVGGLKAGSIINLPGVPTATVGRVTEITAVTKMVAGGETRMVTLVGSGGVGKTRLAVEVGRAVSDRFPDGVAFVDLTAIRSADLLDLAIVGALRLHPAPDRPLRESICMYLAARPRFLLVLDNLEHLKGVEIHVSDLLSLLPQLTILATSREPARIRAERVYRLSSLAVPAAGAPAMSARRASSVELFRQRAQDWGGGDPGATAAGLDEVAALCRHLEGLPLAIELAAARTWESSTGAILSQIEDRLALLRDGPRDLPTRHQTLEATITWSYDLLPAAEQRLFRGVAVFAGGAAPDALTAMFGGDAPALANHLVDKSLATWISRDGEHRLEMLEATRACARQLLERHDELVIRQRAHARYFRDLAVRAGSNDAKRGTQQVAWTRRLEREQENLHLALANCLALGESDDALILTNVMSGYWHTHIPAAQALAWIEQAIALEPAGCHLSAGWSAMWGATFAWQIGDLDTMAAFEDRARWIWAELESQVGLAWVDYSVASRLGMYSRHHEARRLHDANLRVFRQAGDVEGIVKSLCGLSCTHLMTGEPDAAIASLEEALDLSREHDNLVLQSHVLARLPEAYLCVGKIGRAEATAMTGERTALLIGDRLSLPWAAMARAAAESSRGDHQASLEFGRLAVTRFQDAGDRLNEWGGHIACMVATIELDELETARVHAIEAISLLRRHCGEADMATGLAEFAGLVLALGHAREALIACAASGVYSGGHGLPAMPGAGQRTKATADSVRTSLSVAEAGRYWRLGEQGSVIAALDRIERCLDEPAAAISIPA